MKTITIQVTEIEYEALKLLAAELVLRIDEDAVAIATRNAILGYLDVDARVVREEVVRAILEPKEESKKTNGFVEAAKARQEVRVHKRTDPKMPNQVSNGKTTNTWTSWCFLVKTQLNQEGRWSTFTVSDVSRGTGLTSKEATSAMDHLVRNDWYIKTGKTTNDNGQATNLYTFTSKARTWLMDKKNQQTLVDLKVLDELDEWGEKVENGTLSEDVAG